MAVPRNHPEVDAYIAHAPAPARATLREVRRILRAALPGSEEAYSYRMPGLSYPGHPYRGMVVWYALRSSFISLYVRQETIAEHRALLAGYETTKNAVHLPMNRPMPARLIRTLAQASARVVKSS